MLSIVSRIFFIGSPFGSDVAICFRILLIVFTTRRKFRAGCKIRALYASITVAAL